VYKAVRLGGLHYFMFAGVSEIQSRGGTDVFSWGRSTSRNSCSVVCQTLVGSAKSLHI